jgi:hypothetical protein
MLPAVVTLRPPDYYRLFAQSGSSSSSSSSSSGGGGGGVGSGAFTLPPPPLPLPSSSASSSSLSAFGAPLGVPAGAAQGPGAVPALSSWGAEQLYDEACFAPGNAVTPKSELQRLAACLRAAARDTALALADEAAADDAPAPDARRSLAQASRCALLQLNMMHILSRLRELEAWARIEAAAAVR